MGAYEDALARQKRTEEFIKARDMTQSQVVEKLLKAEPELKAKGYSVNLSTYLKENKINPKEIKDTSWMRPVKQTELRKALAEREQILKDPRLPLYSDPHPLLTPRPYTPKIKDPIWNYKPPKAQTKQNDVLPPSVPSEQILEIPQVNTGRIELNPSLPEPRNYYTSLDSSASAKSRINYITEHRKDLVKIGFAIGGIAIAALVLFLILRRRK